MIINNKCWNIKGGYFYELEESCISITDRNHGILYDGMWRQRRQLKQCFKQQQHTGWGRRDKA